MHTGPHRHSGLVSRLRLPCIDLRVAGDEAQDSVPEPVPMRVTITAGDGGTQMLYQIGIIVAMDLNVKGLDDEVGKRLREQAAAAGLSVQQYLRDQLTRVASRRLSSPAAASL